MRVVKAFLRTAHEEARFDAANRALMDQTIRVARLMAIFSPIMLLMVNLAIVAALWIGGPQRPGGPDDLRPGGGRHQLSFLCPFPDSPADRDARAHLRRGEASAARIPGGP